MLQETRALGPKLDAVHVIPGDSANKLVEEIVSSEVIKYGVIEIYQDNLSMRECCEKLGLSFHSLGFKEKNLPKQFLSLVFSLHQKRPKTLFLHSFYPSLFGIGIVLLFPRMKVISVRHHNQVHLLSKNRKGIYLDRLISRLTYKTVAVSNAVKDTLINQGCDSEKIEVIHNGIRRHKLTNHPVTTKSSKLRILAAGRLDWQKNYETMLQVAVELDRLEIDFTLSILGSGSETYRSRLFQMTSELNLDSKVKWLGWQKGIEEWFADSDIFLHTALDEACPLVLIEALLFGIPIVSSDSGGSKEVLSPLYQGCPSTEMSAYVRQILLTWENIVECSASAVSNVSTAESRFGAERMRLAYEDLTLDLISKGN